MMIDTLAERRQNTLLLMQVHLSDATLTCVHQLNQIMDRVSSSRSAMINAMTTMLRYTTRLACDVCGRSGRGQ